MEYSYLPSHSLVIGQGYTNSQSSVLCVLVQTTPAGLQQPGGAALPKEQRVLAALSMSTLGRSVDKNGNGIHRNVSKTLLATLLGCNGEEDEYCPHPLSWSFHLGVRELGINKLVADSYTCNEKK